MEKRLRPKYLVFKIGPDNTTEDQGMESTNPDSVDSPFVLMPRKDPAALAAMVTYARMCEPQLANEIKAWLRTVVEAPVSFGTQGERNLMAAKARSLLDIID